MALKKKKAQPAQPDSTPFPYTKEPGPWIMFLAAYISGVFVAGGPRVITVIVLVSLSILLLIKSPVANMLRTRRAGQLFHSGLAMLALPAFAGLGYSLWLYPPLGLLYAAGALLLALNYYFEGKRTVFPPVYSEACGMAVMGLAAVIGASVAGGILKGLYLWPLFSLFYLASSFRVRYQGRKKKKYRKTGGMYSGALLFGGLAGAALGHMVLLAFLPLAEDVFSAVRQPGEKQKLRQIGMLSAAKVIVFSALVVLLSR